MEELLRPYTNEELDLLFNETGFPEISRQFVKEEFEKDFNEVLTRELRHLDRTSLEKAKKDFQESLDTEFDTLREHIWNLTTTYSYVSEYVKQRELGHGHEWTKLFCNKMKEYSLSENDVMTYFYTCKAFRELRKAEEWVIDRYGCVLGRKKDNLSDQEYILSDQEYIKVVKILSRGEGKIVERFIAKKLSPFKAKAPYLTVEELFQAAMLFQKLYREFISKGILDDEAWEYASDLTTETAHSIKSLIYKEAIKNKAPFTEARKFTLFCEEIIRVCEDDTKTGWFESYYSRVAVAFSEKWQKLILADLIIQKQPKNWRWPDFDKDIKQSFGLESKEEI